MLEAAVHDLTTVPPPDGDADPYSSATRIGPLSVVTIAELMASAEARSAKRAAPAADLVPPAIDAAPATADTAPATETAATVDVVAPAPSDAAADASSCETVTAPRAMTPSRARRITARAVLGALSTVVLVGGPLAYLLAH